MLETAEKKKAPEHGRRLHVLSAFIILAFAALLVRLWHLQIVEGERYAQEADANRLRPQVMQAPRGMIYGRDSSIVLADNRAATDLHFVPADCPDPEAVAARLAELIDIDSEALLEQVAEHRRQPFTQIPVKRDITKTELTRVEENAFALPGVIANVRPQRRYLYGETAGQILGYLGEINSEELARMRPQYRMGDRLGRSGVERMYESVLHGQHGQLLVSVYASGTPQVRTDAYGRPYIETDSFGRRLQQEKVYPVHAGEDIHLTLDIELQAFAESLLEGEKGAIVVLNADTGEVLAMASAPNYDPGIFVDRGRNRERMEALNDSNEPMKNRGFQDAYPPGSVFKVMMAAAALDEGLVDENTTFFCPGHFRLNPGGRAWRCWRRAGHGHMKMDEALAYSCDVYFYNIGLRLNVDRINDWSERFSLGASTGIDLPREETGLIPSREWKRSVMEPRHPDEPWEWNWFDGDTVNLSIGQGATGTSPLQNAVMMAAIVNGGKRVYPYMNQALGPRAEPEPFMSERAVQAVREGLLMCVEKDTFPTGTGTAAQIDGLRVMGKTGTAQVVALSHLEPYDSVEEIPYGMRHHAWFVAGVIDQPVRLAVAVIVEHGHAGSSAAAPLAREVLEYFYTDRVPDPPLTVASGGDGEGP